MGSQGEDGLMMTLACTRLLRGMQRKGHMSRQPAHSASSQLLSHDLPCSRARRAHAIDIQATGASLGCLECLD